MRAFPLGAKHDVDVFVEPVESLDKQGLLTVQGLIVELTCVGPQQVHNLPPRLIEPCGAMFGTRTAEYT